MTIISALPRIKNNYYFTHQSISRLIRNIFSVLDWCICYRDWIDRILESRQRHFRYQRSAGIFICIYRFLRAFITEAISLYLVKCRMEHGRFLLPVSRGQLKMTLLPTCRLRFLFYKDLFSAPTDAGTKGAHYIVTCATSTWRGT